MPRKPIEFNTRFRDVAQIWVAAESRGGVVVQCESHGKAIALIHRLNYCRKIARADTPYHEWDALVPSIVNAELAHDKRNGSFVAIRPRPVPDIATMRTLDGQPITIDDLYPTDRSPDEIERNVALVHERWEIDTTRPLIDSDESDGQRSDEDAK